MATITQENAKQIRDPMRVHIRFEAGGASSITGYSPTANKSYDATLGDTAMTMRKIADLQDGGFPLDGTHEWYVDRAPGDEFGKLGLRSTAGQPVSVTITSNARLDSITIESTGTDYIEKGATRYPSTGLDVIPIMANSATLTFYPDDPNGRVFIKYIVPGAIFNITNDNLISCNVALRSNLSADNPTWEESELEVHFYYPYDVSETLAYIQDDWPLTYEAGYSDEMSEVRKFYLSEPGIQEGNLITLHGLDASSLMDEKVVSERDLTDNGVTTVKKLADQMTNWITSAGVVLAKNSNTGGTASSTTNSAILPEQATRDAVMTFMNLTATLPEEYRFSFVDAGIPTFQLGETYTKVWEIDEEDIAELVFETPRHVNRVVNANADRKFDETFKASTKAIDKDLISQNGAIYEENFDTYVSSVLMVEIVIIKSSSLEIPVPFPNFPIFFSPSRGVWKMHQNATYRVLSIYPYLISGGANQYTDGTNLPGVPIEMDPPVWGGVKFGDISIFSPKNLLNRPNQTVQFKFKGDPRMQPRDFLQINRLDGSTYRARMSAIEITHEGGGTMAVVTAMKTNLWR